MKNIRKLIILTLLCNCAVLHQSKPPSVIITKQSIFLDSTPKSVNLIYDRIIPNLESEIKKQLQGVNLAENQVNSQIILRVKTIFNDKLKVSDIPQIINDEQFSINKKTTIDSLFEDPSGMIVGFAIGASMSNPIVSAPVGLAVGATFSTAGTTLFSKKQKVAILEIEIKEFLPYSVSRTEKKQYKLDGENSQRVYEYKENIHWKVHKTQMIIFGMHGNEEIAKRIISLIL